MTARPIGPRMAEALEFIKANPGCTKAQVFRGTGVRHSTDGTDPIDRLLWRGLVKDLGSSRVYALHATDTPRPPVMRDRLARRDQHHSEPLSQPAESDSEPGYWRPAAHP